MNQQPPWRKSSYSGDTGGNCVELADLGNAVAVRNSNHPDAGTLNLDGDQMAALIADAKAGELDDLT